jgi:tetratricopeptide (TPR) repeat protein
VLTEADPFAAIDLDHCRDPNTHSIAPWAQNFLDVARHTYSEVTPSGEGCRIWGTTGPDTDPVHRKFTLEIDGKPIAAELFRHTSKVLTVTGYRLDTIRELSSLDRAFGWAITWGERRKAAAAEAAQFNSHSFNGGGSGHDIDHIERIVREGAATGSNRSDMFHMVVGHYLGCGWSVEQIDEHLRQYPDGIAGRYFAEGRLSREISRSAGKYTDRALPLLVTVTDRPGAKPDPSFLYYRGLAEYKTGKAADAERSFNAAIKANPKDAASLLYLSQIALSRNDLDTAISTLNRATLNDPRLASAWFLLTSAYLRRATSVADEEKSGADYLGAVRSGETLTRLRSDEEAVGLYARALIGAKQYARAALALERTAASESATGITLYLLGVAHSRANNFPKAIAALERALVKSPGDANVYRELGYDYEKTKQYPKAFALYQKALEVAPNDADFKESLERLRPFAKQ